MVQSMTRPLTIDPDEPAAKSIAFPLHSQGKGTGAASSTLRTALSPPASGSVFSVAPDCEYPSIVTGSVMAGIPPSLVARRDLRRTGQGELDSAHRIAVGSAVVVGGVDRLAKGAVRHCARAVVARREERICV